MDIIITTKAVNLQSGNSHMVQITDLKAPAKDGSGEEVSFDGCYMVNNLGKLSASPQVRYMV